MSSLNCQVATAVARFDLFNVTFDFGNTLFDRQVLDGEATIIDELLVVKENVTMNRKGLLIYCHDDTASMTTPSRHPRTRCLMLSAWVL